MATPDRYKPLTPVSVQRRELEALERNSKQKIEWDKKRLEDERKQHYQSYNASTDDYMKEALSKVRKSNVSIPQDLAMFNGTFIYKK